MIVNDDERPVTDARLIELEVRALAAEARCGKMKTIEGAARALITREDFWGMLKDDDLSLPGEYDDLVEALAALKDSE